jgi:hypothetical protein
LGLFWIWAFSYHPLILFQYHEFYANKIMFQSASAGTPLNGLSNIVAGGRQQSQLEAKPSYIHNTQPLHHVPTEPQEAVDFESRKAIADSEKKQVSRKPACKKGKRCYGKRAIKRKPNKKKKTIKKRITKSKKPKRKTTAKKGKKQWRRQKR